MAKKEELSKSDQTKITILEAGLKIWPNVTNRAVGREIGMTHPNISYHFGDKLEDAVAKYAIEKGDSKVIAQMIATNHKAVRKMSQTDRMKHLRALA